MESSVECPICGSEFKQLQSHLSQSPHCASQLVSNNNNVSDYNLRQEEQPVTPTHLLNTESIGVASENYLPQSLEQVITEETAAPVCCHHQHSNQDSNEVETRGQEYVETGDLQQTDTIPSPEENHNSSNSTTNHLEDHYSLEEAIDDFGLVDSTTTPTKEPSTRDRTTITLEAMGVTYSELILGESNTYPIQKQVQHLTTSITPLDKVLAKIHHKCDQAGAPRYLADDILKLLKEETVSSRFNITDPRICKRQALMKRLQLAIKTQPVEEIPITLESGLQTTVYRFPFIDRLQRHLLSPVFADLENINLPLALDTTKINPFEHNSTKLPPLDFSDMTNGQWYRHATQDYRYLTDTGKYLLHPLILYGDKTGVDKIEKNSLEPFAISSAILTRSAREDAENWVLLGYVPNLKVPGKKKGIKSTTSSKRSMSIRDIHHCLTILLDPLRNTQASNPVLLFRRGDIIAPFKIIPPIMAVIGDNLSNDTLSQRVQDYGATSPRLSRRCLCLPQDADKPNHICHRLPGKIISKLSMGALGVMYGIQDDNEVAEKHRQTVVPKSPNLPLWQEYVDSQRTLNLKHTAVQTRKHRETLCDAILHQVVGCHTLMNAFHDIDFGPVDNGIHRATLTDIMHTIEEGIVPKILEVFFELMPASSTTAIDTYVNSAFGNPKFTVRNGEGNDNYPRITFRQGYTKLTHLSASERMGQLFLLSIVLQTKEGRRILQNRFSETFDSDRAKARDKFQGVPSHLLEDEDTGEEHAEPPDISQPETTTPDPPLSMDRITAYLNQIHLGYVVTELHPSLPSRHQHLLTELLTQKIKGSWLKQASNHDQLPNLDYNMPPIHHTRPSGSNVEALHQFQNVTTMGDIKEGWVPNIPRTSEEEEDGCVPRSIALNMNEFSYLIETILAFHRCLKDPHCLFEEEDDVTQSATKFKSFSLALSQLLVVLVHGIRRFEGSNKWRIRKIVELSHFLPDIIQYGCADGFNSSTGERNLKVWAKKPSKTAQKRSAETHSGQTASRLNETFILQQTLQEPATLPQIQREDHSTAAPTLKKQFSHLGSQSETFYLDTDTGCITKSPGDKKKVESHKKPLSPVAIEWFQSEFEGDSSRVIPIFTEFFVGRELCRVHANFRDEGPWYDCVAILTEKGEHIPARLAAVWLDDCSEIREQHRLMVLLQKPTVHKPQHLIKADKQSQLFSHLEFQSSTIPGSNFIQADLEMVPLDHLCWRTICIDSNVDFNNEPQGINDPFTILVTEEGSRKGFEIMWTNRDNWPMMFLESPGFAKIIGDKRKPGSRKKRRKISRS